MLDLTNDEKQILINALDVATKATGLQGASALLPIAMKIQSSMQTKEEEPQAEA